MRTLGRTLLSVMVATLLALTLLAAPAAGSFPGRNGKIAYVLAGHVYSVNPDGSGIRRLTVNGSNAGPGWSADGRRIAFTRNKNIYVMNADGSSKRRVTSIGRDLQPAWSPDGRHLVFIRLQSNGRGDLFRIPSAGGTATRLTSDAITTGGNDRPTWSPRGDLILFLHYQSTGMANGVIKTLNPATGQQRVIPAGVPLAPSDSSWGPDSVARPEWAPNGNSILFLAKCATSDDCAPAAVNVMRSDLQTTTRTRLTHYVGIDGEWDDLDSFAVGPDGTSLIHVGCWDLDPRTQTYAFCGIRPGNIRDAHSPDWQPRPL